MNENNNYNKSNVGPYKASGNLNTFIGNPSVNINDTMDVNIQSIATNDVNKNDSNGINTSFENVHDSLINQSVVQNNHQIGVNLTNTPINNANANYSTNTTVTNVNNNSNNTNRNDNNVTKTYVGVNGRAKKKNIQLKLGSEFKMALLIIVILMIFIFLLPKISEIFRGY